MVARIVVFFLSSDFLLIARLGQTAIDPIKYLKSEASGVWLKLVEAWIVLFLARWLHRGQRFPDGGGGLRSCTRLLQEKIRLLRVILNENDNFEIP